MTSSTLALIKSPFSPPCVTPPSTQSETSQEEIEEEPIVFPTESTLTDSTFLLTDLIAQQRKNLNCDIAKHSLHDCIFRVFHDPLRSFLEIVTNALDACTEHAPIGKLGIGFLSILSFLVHSETSGCQIKMTTTYMHEGHPFSYSIFIYNEGEYTFVRFIKEEKEFPLGTTLKILPNQSTFSSQTLETIKHYLYYLQFYPHGNIEVASKEATFYLGAGKTTKARIQLQETELETVDEGCGVPLTVACNHLFTPSSSTKIPSPTNFPDILPKWVNYQGKKGNDDYFLLVMDGVIIVELPLTTTFNKDLLLVVPSLFKLTLGRNALVFSEHNRIAEEFFKKVILQLIDEVIDNHHLPAILYMFYHALMKLEKKSSQIHALKLSLFLKKSLHQKLSQTPDKVPFPYESQKSLFPIIFSLIPKIQLFPIHRDLYENGFEHLESSLEKAALEVATDPLEIEGIRQRLVEGKVVIFVDDSLLPQIPASSAMSLADGGLKRILFAPKSLILRSKHHQSSQPLQKRLAFSCAYRFCSEGLQVSPYSFPVSTFTVNTLIVRNFAIATSLSSQADFHLFFSPHEALERGILKDVDGAIFQTFWKTYGEEALMALSCRHPTETRRFSMEFSDWRNNVIKLLFPPDAYFEIKICPKSLNQLIDTKEKEIQVENYLTQLIFYHQGKVWLPLRDNIKALLNKLNILGNGNCHRNPRVDALIHDPLFFRELNEEEVGKLIFEFILCNCGIHSRHQEDSIFSHQLLYPFSSPITVESLERLFFSLIKDSTLLFNPLWNRARQKYHYCHLIGSQYIKNFDEETWRDLDSFLNYEAYYRQPITSIIAPLLLVKEIFFKSQTADSNRNIFLNVYTALLDNYRHYFTISDKDFPYIYSSNSLHNLFTITEKTRNQSEFYTTVDDAYRLLYEFQDDALLFEKILFFLKEAFNDLLHIEKRNENLARKNRIYLTSILGYNAFALLSRLHAEGIPRHYLEVVIAQSKTQDEAFILCALLFDSDLLPLFKERLISSAALEGLILGYLQKAPSPQELKNLLKIDQLGSSISTFLKSTVTFSTMKDFFLSLQRQSLHETTALLDPSLQASLSQAHSFTTYQLLDAIREGSLEAALQTKNLDIILPKIRSANSSSHLQVVKECIEHRNDHLNIEDVLLESLQNSIDAISSHLSTHEGTVDEKCLKVTFSIQIIKGERAPQCVLKIHDGIGMKNLQTLLVDFLVPNYSQKSQERESIGQMGNGSFSYYREAEKVYVKTRLQETSEIFLLRTLPIRDHLTGEVKDLRHKCVQIPDTSFFGTEITIVYRNSHQDPLQPELIALTCRSFLREVVACAHVTLPGNLHPTLLFKNACGEEVLSEIDSQLSPFSLPSQEPFFTFIKTKNPKHPGWVLTGGVPFKPLGQFLQEQGLVTPFFAENYCRGYCLVLPVNSYAPVHSRKQVILNQNVKENLRYFIAEWFFFRCLCDEVTGPNKKYFLHFQSQGIFLQLYPLSNRPLFTQKELIDGMSQRSDDEFFEQFFHYFISYFSKDKNFAFYIDQGYKTLVNQLAQLGEKFESSFYLCDATRIREVYTQSLAQVQKLSAGIFEEWKKQLFEEGAHSYLNDFINVVVIPWFDVKIQSFIHHLPSLEQIKQKYTFLKEKQEESDQKALEKVLTEKLGVTKEHVIEIAEKILLLYCHLFQRLNFPEMSPLTLKFFEDPASVVVGRYLRNEHRIEINLQQLADILDFGYQVLHYDRIHLLPIASWLMISPGNCGMLNHELEHARRNSSCNHSSSHGHGYDLLNRYVHFEACAASFARKAHQLGLFDLMAEEMEKLLASYSLSEKTFYKIVCKLKKWEAGGKTISLSSTNKRFLTSQSPSPKKTKLNED